MAVVDGRSGYAWRKVRAEVLAYSDVCWLCGLGGSTTVDHIIPLRVLKQTGRMDLANDPANLRPAHLRCNSGRGDRAPRQSKPPSRRW